MAHSPQTKAKVIADIVKGVSLSEAERKHGVPKATISRWVEAEKTERKTEPKRNKGQFSEIRTQTPAERQRAAFDQKLIALLGASLEMLEAWALECKNPEFIKKNPEGVNELGRTVLDRCDRILELVRSNHSGKPGE
jgi:hypothetical protein